MVIHSHAQAKAAIWAISFFGVSGLLLIIKSFKRWRRANEVLDTGTARVKSAAQGHVELQGYAWPISLTQTAMDQKLAIFYKLVLEEYVKTDKSSHWVKVFEEQTIAPFFLTDGSGLAVIFPGDIELEARKRMMEVNLLSDMQKQQLFDFVQSRKPEFHSEGVFGILKKRFRYIETAIWPGSPIYALGEFKSMSGLERYHPLQGLSKFLQNLSVMKKGPLLKMTGPTDDSRVTYNALALQSAQNFSSKEMDAESPPLCGTMTSTPQTKLFIADCHQEELLSRLGSHNISMMFVGAFLISVGVVLSAFFIFKARF